MDCLLWEANDPGTDRRMTYSEVLAEVCRLVRSLHLNAKDPMFAPAKLALRIPRASSAKFQCNSLRSIASGGM